MMGQPVGDPKLRASFQLGSDGKPSIAYARPSVPTHYDLRLWIENAPSDAYSVTYKLHHSYYDPIRYNESAGTSFAEKITSYGDYTVEAEIATGRGRSRLREELSAMLAKTYGSDTDENIKKAILDIKSDGSPPEVPA
jgi:hypothetical protein